MENDDGRILDRLAEAITDETEVDWDAEQAAHPELATPLTRLRLIERIAGVHRASPDEPSTADEPALFTWGHLAVLEEIGQGGFGIVYRAYDPRLRREVALKLLHPDRAERAVDTSRFLAEARRMARVRHQGVLAIHGAAEHDGQPGFWCDLLEGETLARRLERDGPCGAGEAAAMGLELCRALAAVHAAGLVHGDVKAANVMRDGQGRLVLMDFGAGSDAAPGAGGADSTILGTPMVLAPELFDGAEPSSASDLYAVGALLYQLVTGRYPVTASSLGELHRKLQVGQRVPLLDRRPDLPVAFVTVVERALAPQPGHRHHSAGDMASALGGALRSIGSAGVSGRARRRRRILAAVAAAVVVGAVASGLLLLSPETRPVATPDEATAAAFPATAPLTAEATLFRSQGGAREALPAGALVRPGDTLYLEYQGSRPAHVYVLNEDDLGDVFLLFPLPGQDLANPLPPDRRHRLPGPHDGVLQDWQVTGGEGREAFLVVAAATPVAWFEETVASFPPASPARPVRSLRLDPAGLSGTRGVEGIVPAGRTAGDDAGDVLDDIGRRLATSAAEPGGIWIRQFVIYNAGR